MKFEKLLFEKYWHLVCHRSELPIDGDFLKFKTPIGDIVIFNDVGDYIAFDNRCPHRGAPIYLTESGNQVNTCKYHGWTFKAGKMIIPFIEQFEGCNIESVDLKKYKLEWCGDFLFVSVTPSHDLYTQLNSVSQYIEDISFNINGRLDLSAYEYECAWPIAIENALEPYHVSMIHPDTLATLNLESGVNTFHGANSIWRAPLGNDRIKKQLEKIGKYFNIDYGYKGYLSIYMFPFTMISSTYGYSYSLQNFFPSAIRNDRTNFMSRFFACNLRDEHAKKIIHPFFISSASVNRQVFEEDHSMCKTIPADAWSLEPLRFISVQEVKIARFRDACKAELLLA